MWCTTGFSLRCLQGTNSSRIIIDDDPDRWIECCEIMTSNIIAQPQVTKNICFHDECTFYLKVNVSYNNMNPRAIRGGHTTYQEKT